MNQPKKTKRDQALYELIAEYEQSSRQGLSLFLGEHAFLQLLDYYEEEEQLEKAVEVAERAISQHVYSPDFYLRKAYLLLRSNREDQALSVLEQAAVYAPGELEIALLRAEALVYKQQFEEALAELEPFKAEASAEELSDICLVESLVYEQQENYDQMYESLKHSLRLNPLNDDSLERIWLCVEFGNKHEDSIAVYTAVIDENPYSHLAWHNLGHAYAFLKRFDDAIEAYEYAFLIKDDFSEAYLDFADLCFEQQYYDRALQAYQEVEKQIHSDSELYMSIGLCWQNLGRYREAKQSYLFAIGINPQHEEVYFHLGECFAAEGDWRQAARYFNQAVRIEPNEAEFQCAAAEAAYQLDHFAQAETAFQKAISLAPDTSRYWLDYAWYLLDTSRAPEAVSVLEEAVETINDPELSYARVACLLAAGRRQEGCVLLGYALQAHYDAYPRLYEWLPGLSADPAITAMIGVYRPS